MDSDPASATASAHIPTLAAIEAAKEAIRPIVVNAPLFESERVNDRAGGRILIKAETLQPTGSFKVRGAWNHISKMSAEQRAQGILAVSSGNHAQAVAWSARRQGVGRTIILMPQTAPSAKVERTRDLGAEVVFFDPVTVNYPALVGGWIMREKLHFVHPFDDPDIIAGAATVGYETVHQARAMGADLDDVLVACSGGGLLAGTALSLEALSPKTRLWGVEPSAYDDTARSLAAGELVRVPQSGETICDTLTSPTPGSITFSINRSRVAGVRIGGDAEAIAGMRAAFSDFGLASEPGGALALGILLSDRSLTEGRTIAVVLSGRNVDPRFFASCLS